MDRSEARPASEPTYVDALLLMALDYAEGRRLKEAYVLVDVLEHMVIEPSEWEHACHVLGERGLVQDGPGAPVLTDAGKGLLMAYSSRLSRPVARQIAEELKSMPVGYPPASPPSREAQERAVTEYLGVTPSDPNGPS